MTRDNLLRLVADRGDGTWPRPSCVDNLNEPAVPALVFHGYEPADLLHWRARLCCVTGGVSRTVPAVRAGDPPVRVTTWRGEYLGTPVDLLLFTKEHSDAG